MVLLFYTTMEVYTIFRTVSFFPVSPVRNIRVVVTVQPNCPTSGTLPQGPPGLSGVGEGGDAT